MPQRFRFRFRFRVVWCFAVLLTIATSAVQAQTATVRGRVIETGTSTRVAGATVELSGVGNTLTDRNGQFSFERVPAGAHTLTLRSLGYAERQIDITVNRDTTLVIELDVSALPMDSLVVRNVLYTLRGTVDDSRGRAVIDADVYASSKRAATNLAGSFKIKDLPANAPIQVRVEAVGYNPVQLQIAPQRDTTLRFRLSDDSLGLRMLAVQVKRLTTRSAATPYSRLQFDRDRLARSAAASVPEFLRQQGVGTPRCLFIDDVEKPFTEILDTYYPDEFERIEVIQKGIMVRLYTRRYIARLQSKPRLPPIVIMDGGSRPMCQ